MYDVFLESNLTEWEDPGLITMSTKIAPGARSVLKIDFLGPFSK